MNPEDKYDVILADPPWKFSAWSEKESRTADAHYPVMTFEDIKALDIHSIISPNAALFLWVPNSMMEYLFWLMPAWGFQYKTVGFDWVKLSKKRLEPKKAWMYLPRVALKSGSYRPHFGMGHYSRQGNELCFLGVRGSMPVADKSVRQTVFAPISSHSSKPVEVHRRIEKLYPKARKLELFARRAQPGWDVWGDEAPDAVELEL